MHATTTLLPCSCGSTHIMDRRWKPLPFPLQVVSLFVPLRTARCGKCRRPRICVSWRRVPLRWSCGLLLIGSLVALDYVRYASTESRPIVSSEPRQLAHSEPLSSQESVIRPASSGLPVLSRD